jgi:hypothetical protein
MPAAVTAPTEPLHMRCGRHPLIGCLLLGAGLAGQSRVGTRPGRLHIAAATQVRLDTEGRRYYRCKLATGRTRMEAMRCLKRRISDANHRARTLNRTLPASIR